MHINGEARLLGAGAQRMGSSISNTHRLLLGARALIRDGHPETLIPRMGVGHVRKQGRC